MENWITGLAIYTGAPIDVSYDPKLEEGSRWKIIIDDLEPGFGATPLAALVAAAHAHAVKTGAAAE